MLCLAQSLLFSLLLTLMEPAVLLLAALWRGPNGCEQREANSQQRIKTLKAHKDLNPANEHVTAWK